MNQTEMANVLGPMFEAISKDGELALNELSLPKTASILDVGTGMGYFAIYLASQGFQVITGEPETDDSIYAKRPWAANAESVDLIDSIRFQAFSASEMPFESQIFDSVFFFGVLHHIEANRRAEAFREAFRVTKPGGSVVFFEPTLDTLNKVWADDPGHPYPADPFQYLPEESIPCRQLCGTLMDIYVFKR